MIDLTTVTGAMEGATNLKMGFDGSSMLEKRGVKMCPGQTMEVRIPGVL